MSKGKRMILVCALLVFLVGLAAFAGQIKVKGQAPRADLTLLKIPHITNVTHHIYGDPPPEIDMQGTNFGTTKGTKNVTIDGTLVTSYILGWHDTSVSFNPPFTFIYWDHVYQFAIADGPNVVSNIYSIRIPWDFDAMIPKEGPVGTEVEITVYKLSPRPMGLYSRSALVIFPSSPDGGGDLGKNQGQGSHGHDGGRVQREFAERGRGGFGDVSIQGHAVFYSRPDSAYKKVESAFSSEGHWICFLRISGGSRFDFGCCSPIEASYASARRDEIAPAHLL